MAQDLRELKDSLTPPVAKASLPGVNHNHLPFWVVVLSQKLGKDGKARLKYVLGHSTEEEAESHAKEKRADEPTFQFFVVNRPHNGAL